MATECHRSNESRKETELLSVSLFLSGSLWAEFENDPLLSFIYLYFHGKYCSLQGLPGRFNQVDKYMSDMMEAGYKINTISC
jgi:hypothetical protein